jgi:hypothetical protein
VERPNSSLRLRWVKVPCSAQLARLTRILARRIGRYLERQGLLERGTENSYLAGDDLEAGPLDQLFGLSITYRIAVGPQQGRKVITLPPVASRSMKGSVKSPDFHYTPAWRRERINARSSSGCAATSVGQPLRSSACRSHRTATSAFNTSTFARGHACHRQQYVASCR